MHRRVGTSLALVVSTLAFVAGCSGTSVEQKLLSDFFRAARLRDSATLRQLRHRQLRAADRWRGRILHHHQHDRDRRRRWS